METIETEQIMGILISLDSNRTICSEGIPERLLKCICAKHSDVLIEVLRKSRSSNIVISFCACSTSYSI